MAAVSAHPVSFVVERSRTRIAPAAVASAAWHLAFAAFVVLLMRSGPHPPFPAAYRSWSGSQSPCVVRPDGTVGDVQIVRSLDPTFGLDLQAIAAVKQWKFAAGTRLGEPVAVRITIELTFTLR